MKRDNKKALYESIITSVAKEVKKVLNEEVLEDQTTLHIQEIADQIVNNKLTIKNLDFLCTLINDQEYEKLQLLPAAVNKSLRILYKK